MRTVRRTRRAFVPPAAGVRPTASPPNLRARILGLDPGSRATGYAVIECAGNESSYLVSGAIRTEGEAFTDRLGEIFAGIARLVEEYRPDEVAIERVFVHRNADSALKLGQARGAALCATFAQRPPDQAAIRAHIYEYAPREIKLAVTGTGSAQKEQVQLMVRQLLKLKGNPGADAADALAVALCHVHARRLHRWLASTR